MSKEVIYEVREPKTLTDMNTQELKKALETSNIAVLSFGAIEDHSEHIPLGTDTFQGNELIKRTAERLTEQGLPAIPAFCVPFGVQTNRFERDNFFGNVCLSQSTFIKMVTELVLSLVDNGFKRFVFCMSHAENFAALNVVAKDLGDLYDIPVIVPEWIPYLRDEMPKLIKNKNFKGHGGANETGAMMVLAPKLVNMNDDIGSFELPDDNNPVFESGLYYYGGSVGIFTPVREDESPGFEGKPGDATKEVGELFLDKCAEWTADVVLKYWGK